MKKSTLTLLALATALSLSLSGCGSNRGSGGDQTAQAGGDGITGAQTLGIENCATCHNQGTSVTADWMASRHANGNAVPDTDNPTCTVCHDQLSDGLQMSLAFAGQAERGVVGCESCHGGGQLHRGIGPLPFPVPGPEQCGQCHGVDQALFHGTRAERLINDTHFDNPATADIEGFVVKTAEQQGCQVCHFNGHNPTLEINDAWARSAHGGHLLSIKDAAATVDERLAAAVTDADAPGWVHYNWDQTTGTGNRASCQRCHTATGIANYLTDPAGYDPANNDFSHLADWTPGTGSPQNEMLYCWGCHADSKGSLRDPGAITADYTGASFTYPDVAESNVCMACHTGRESGGSIAARAANPATDWSNLSFINSHYLTAGGTIFSASGYHYAGREYQTPSNLHAGIGTAGSAGTSADDNGPCVKCHMSSAGAGQSHSFAVVTKDAADLVTAINPDFCNACHVGALALAAGDLNSLRDGFDAALDALEAQLAAKGFVFQPNHPYFATKNWGDAATGPNNMGAAFNFNLLAHDPGAYAHNVRYADRLIWDSIDWLDDNLLNNSTVAAINALGLPVATRDAAVAWIGLSRP
ncbi:c-type cytochrome [Desulfuromonas versatilis]|uniref:C-type cytochrome n=1 Tax=Desulfuromonas versatilis TaxID=2802975 RepID=A0ABN6E7W1_9BACT|nr:cytochrome c family protein [Desulfuromonas versatilis]BCR06776.1 c-type cytochrome [Desulfuromonas versatilis]